MKRLIGLSLCVVSAAGANAQTDHDNLDAGRPLQFEDAEPIARGGLAIEFGFNSDFARRRRAGFSTPVAVVWGGSLNTQWELGSRGSFGGGQHRFRLEGIHVGNLTNLRRQIKNQPALAVKWEAELPTGRDERVALRLRGIATQSARQYDRVHLNLDLDVLPNPHANQRRFRLGAVLGYTTPVGYFTHFDTTALAEISVREGALTGDPLTTGIGLGIRRQMSPRTVLDMGVQSELSGTDRVPLRFIAGYSISF